MSKRPLANLREFNAGKNEFVRAVGMPLQGRNSPNTKSKAALRLDKPQGSLKTGQSGSLQNRTTVKARDIDVDRGPYRLCRHEQCLERRKETTSHRTGKARMVFTKDRARNRCST